MMRAPGLAAILAVVVALPLSARAATNPPPSYSVFVPICYKQTNGNMRSVKPWGVVGATIPNCTPPPQWQVSGTAYDPTMCNSGGSFDCRKNEFYNEIPVFSGTALGGPGAPCTGNAQCASNVCAAGHCQ